MRKTQFATGEFYHIFNRGTDKREIFSDNDDLSRFFQSMDEFNTEKPIGSIFENTFKKDKNEQLGSSTPKLVEFIVFCLNANHFHFILKQNTEGGIIKFMQKLGTGYTNYFNNKHKRSGALFQGKYKSIFIDSNEYLLHLSAYVNLNNKVHRLGDRISKSSWSEYDNATSGICEKEIILGQFKNSGDYKKFAESSLEDILQRRGVRDDIKNFLLE